MIFYPNERTSIFIDGPNLYAATKALNLEFDFRNLIHFFQKNSQFYKAFYYTPLLENHEHSNIQPLIDWLDYNQFEIITKMGKTYVDDEHKKRIKSSIAIDFCVDVMFHSDFVDHLILFTGDGDYLRLVEALKQKGKKVTIISTTQADSCIAADALRRKADQFVELSSQLSFIKPHLKEAV